MKRLWSGCISAWRQGDRLTDLLAGIYLVCWFCLWIVVSFRAGHVINADGVEQFVHDLLQLQPTVWQ